MEQKQTAPDRRLKSSTSRGFEQVFRVIKWLLILFNAGLMVTVLGALWVYFSEFRERSDFKLPDATTDSSLSREPSDTMGPKYAWLLAMAAYTMMLAIPCIGFIGSVKESMFLLILYGVIFSVEAVVFLIFRSRWFLLPAAVALLTMGLVIMKRDTRNRGDEQKEPHPKDWGLRRVLCSSMV